MTKRQQASPNGKSLQILRNPPLVSGLERISLRVGIQDIEVGLERILCRAPLLGDAPTLNPPICEWP